MHFSELTASQNSHTLPTTFLVSKISCLSEASAEEKQIFFFKNCGYIVTRRFVICFKHVTKIEVDITTVFAVYI